MLIFKCYTLYVIFEIIGYWLVLNWGDSLKFPSAGLNIFRNYQIQWNHKSKYLYENFNTTSFSTTVQYKSGHKRLNQASKAQQWKSLLNCCKTSKSFTTTEAERSPVRFHLHKGRTLSLRKWLKPIVVAICAPSQSTNEALPSSLQIEAFYLSTFYTRDFHLVLSPWTLSIFYVVARMWPLHNVRKLKFSKSFRLLGSDKF